MIRQEGRVFIMEHKYDRYDPRKEDTQKDVRDETKYNHCHEEYEPRPRLPRKRKQRNWPPPWRKI